MRKTFRVEGFIVKVNTMIAATNDDMAAERLALATVLESVLIETGNYHGFNYLRSEWTEEGTLKPGADLSRRRYYSC